MTDDNVNGTQLLDLIARIEDREDQKAEVADQIKEIYEEAKSLGFDTKILRKVISLRKKTPEERDTEESILEAYLAALGMKTAS